MWLIVRKRHSITKVGRKERALNPIHMISRFCLKDLRSSKSAVVHHFRNLISLTIERGIIPESNLQITICSVILACIRTMRLFIQHTKLFLRPNEDCKSATFHFGACCSSKAIRFSWIWLAGSLSNKYFRLSVIMEDNAILSWYAE